MTIPTKSTSMKCQIESARWPLRLIAATSFASCKYSRLQVLALLACVFVRG